jgi:hypothetical protein
MNFEENKMKVSPLAGKPADESMLVDVAGLVTSYYAEVPEPSVPAQRVAFGTSGHRGSSFERTFNEAHILTITQAICLYRKQQRIGYLVRRSHIPRTDESYRQPAPATPATPGRTSETYSNRCGRDSS